METAVTSIRRRNDKKNPLGELIDISSILKVESTSNQCHNFHVDSPFKIDEISTKFPCGISLSNRWRIDEDVSIGFTHIMMYVFSITDTIKRFSINNSVQFCNHINVRQMMSNLWLIPYIKYSSPLFIFYLLY